MRCVTSYGSGAFISDTTKLPSEATDSTYATCPVAAVIPCVPGSKVTIAPASGTVPTARPAARAVSSQNPPFQFATATLVAGEIVRPELDRPAHRRCPGACCSAQSVHWPLRKTLT